MASRNIIFVKSEMGFITNAITKNLEEAGFKVIEVMDDFEDFGFYSSSADMILYYVSGSKEIIRQKTAFLTNVCNEWNKTLCLVGDERCVDEACKTEDPRRIVGVFKRPVDIQRLVLGIYMQLDKHMEFERTKSILLVDDEPDYVAIMSLWLEDKYKVNGVCSGKEALRYLDKYIPDLILLDYDMPDIDGGKVFEKIRSNSLLAKIPVIFLTGKNDRETVMKIINQKPEGYLLKSVARSEIIEVIDGYFADKTLSA